jgi:hypothetical protein
LLSTLDVYAYPNALLGALDPHTIYDTSHIGVILVMKMGLYDDHANMVSEVEGYQDSDSSPDR